MNHWVGVAGIASLMFLNGCACTQRGCIEGIVLDDALRISTAEPIRGAVVELCHNDVCMSGALPGDGSELTNDLAVELTDGVRTATVWTHEDAGDHAFALMVTTDRSVMRDGDMYSLTVTTTDGRELGRSSWLAVSHREQYPNGERCGGACRVPVLEPI